LTNDLQVLDMPAQDYFAAEGLSYSSLCDLAVSPYRYWYLHKNPNAPLYEPTPEQRLGTALHTAVLEPGRFESAYAREVALEDIPGCLRTVDDMKAWLRERGVTPKGTLKADIIRLVQHIDITAPILDVMKAEHAERNTGKIIMKSGDFSRVLACASAVLAEPQVRGLLDGAQIERSLFRRDPETGVLLKGRLDASKRLVTVDFKTFSQMSKSIDQTITDAIWNRRYHHQAFVYFLLRGWPDWDGTHVMVFVESDPPHEVRIRSIKPKLAGQPSMLFDRARIEVRSLIDRYAACVKHFGARPWRSDADIDPIDDSEIKALAYL
jgi:PDDEXK-like domain of unknown function (DUF3799)